MTALQAFEQAQETGLIKTTKETANILSALAAFDQAAEDLTNAIDANLPVELIDRSDEFTGGFYSLYSELQDYTFKIVGEIILKSVFLYKRVGQFEGL